MPVQIRPQALDAQGFQEMTMKKSTIHFKIKLLYLSIIDSDPTALDKIAHLQAQRSYDAIRALDADWTYLEFYELCRYNLSKLTQDELRDHIECLLTEYLTSFCSDPIHMEKEVLRLFEGKDLPIAL